LAANGTSILLFGEMNIKFKMAGQNYFICVAVIAVTDLIVTF